MIMSLGPSFVSKDCSFVGVHLVIVLERSMIV